MTKHFRLLATFFLIAMIFALFHLPISAHAAQIYDVTQEGILSEYYCVDREQGYIKGITLGTSVQKLLSACTPAGTTASTETVATGTVISYAAGDQQISLTAIVGGDLNGDGDITISDLLIQKSFLLGETLSPLETAAGDLNNDGDITVTDFIRVKSHLLGLEYVDVTYAGGELFLMEPGKTAVWQIADAHTYKSDNADLVAVDDAGAVTAAQKEGSAFLYAYAQDGRILARQMVTVLKEPLTVTLDKESCILPKGHSMTLTPRFNHPVEAKVTWTSSNPSVATVDNGVITGVQFGTTTVIAALENGFQVEVDVTIAPPVEELRIERALYKIKPGNSKAVPLFVSPVETGEEFIWTSSDTSVATVSADGTVTGVSYGTVTITATGKYSRMAVSCQVKVCDVIQVAITFDDGPSSHTAKLLDYLKEKDIRATFFMVGERITYYKDTVIREAAEGHELGYHSYSHAMQTSLSSEKIISDFNLSNKTLYDLTGKNFTVWRTPGGDYNQRVLNCVPLPHIFWSVDTLDWKTRNTDAVYRAIMQARDGDIILLHDLYPTTVEGAIWAMSDMLAGDYEFLTVTELLSRKGTPPKNSVNYYSDK